MSITMAPPMVHERHGVVLLGFHDVVSQADAALLHKALRSLMRQRLDTVVVDLNGARDVTRATWETLVSSARRLRRGGGRVVLRNCPEDIHSFLMVQHWDRCFLFPDRCPSDAVALPARLREWLTSDDVLAAQP